MPALVANTMPNDPPLCHAAERLASARLMLWTLLGLLGLLGCGSVDPNARVNVSKLECAEWTCEGATKETDYLQKIGCHADFDALASAPMDATIPGARSVKVIFDRENGDALYFQNSTKYQIHWDFASQFLPNVAARTAFNTTEYYSPSRRFILGAVTYYEEPKVWVLELAPYDRADAPMMAELYAAVKNAGYFGCSLAVHPTSVMVERTAKNLPQEVPVETTADIFAGTSYQPLNLGTGLGYLRFVKAAQLGSTYLTSHDIVVLDHVPNDITVVMGLITEEFQTPLSHVNVLSQNRGTPNMGLRQAMTNTELRALENRWVRLDVGAESYSIKEVAASDAIQWWGNKRDCSITVRPYDTTVTELKNIEDIVSPDRQTAVGLNAAIKEVIPAFGGKATHFSVLAQIPEITVPTAFGIPIYYYDQFMRENGFADRVAAMLADDAFQNDPQVRDERLGQLRFDMQHGTVNQTFQDRLRAKLQERLPDTRVVRFRSSTNGEDLEGFTGAGLYASNDGVMDNWESVLDGVRATWAATWRFRAFEERDYHCFPQTGIGMALLVHPKFTNELATGVCLTANPFDATGIEEAFYVNTQWGNASVVLPDAGDTTDEFLHFFTYTGQPTAYLNQSNLLPPGRTSVLTNAQIHELGLGLDAIDQKFSPAYGPRSPLHWYAMDVEFKLNVQPGTTEPHIVFKQARPHPGRGSDPLAAEDG
jgi:hypothetical protein